MEVYKGDISKFHGITRASVVTLGNFDGVHRGHQYLLEKTVSSAKEAGVPAVAISFSPHPSIFFKTPGFGLLSSEARKQELLSATGLDYWLVQTFDSEFAKISAEDFLRHFLIQPLKPARIHLGYDYRFGAGGAGDYNFALSLLSPLGVQVYQESAFKLNGETVSSTLIRDCLLDGQVKKANALLGYSYSVSGEVVKGQALGRQIGFPTANLENIKTLVPDAGVYAGFATVRGNKYAAIVNIGVKPTVSKTNVKTFECHILNFSGTIYGEVVAFEFVEKVRDEIKFTNVEMLTAQISKDIEQAQFLLGE